MGNIAAYAIKNGRFTLFALIALVDVHNLLMFEVHVFFLSRIR